MNGKHHYSINLLFLIISLFVIWHYLHEGRYFINAFGFYFLIVTVYLNPDIDTKSKPSNNLGFLKYIFLPLRHRGISHNLFAWAVGSFLFGYFGFIPEGIGMFMAAFCHIFCDKGSSYFKKLYKKIF